MNGIRIRAYRESDWEGVCRVHDGARPLEVQHFMPEEFIKNDPSLKMVQAVNEDGAFFESDIFVALADGEEVVGFIGVRAEEITWMFVDPDHHRRGIGAKLVAHVRPQLEPNGYVLCAQENAAGFRFYQAVGFEPVAFFPGHERGYACTCVRMTFPGSVHAERAPSPVKRSLVAHGYGEGNWGGPVRDAQGIWYWVRD